MGFMEEQLKRRFKAGDVIFKDGDQGQSMFIVLDGQVEISKVLGDHKTILDNLPKGSIFGEMAIVENQPRSATATATTDTQVFEVSRDMFNHRLEEVPKWLQSFFSIMAGRLRTATRNQSILLTQGAGRQIVSLLAMMFKEVEPDLLDKLILSWNKATSTIAFMLAFNPDQVVETINKLVLAGLLNNDRRENIGRVLILENADRFYQLADYCRELYHVEGDNSKELPEAFRFKSEFEYEMLQAIEAIVKDQGVMDDFPESALQSYLQENFGHTLATYREVLDDFSRIGLLERFQPGGEDAGFRIQSREALNEKLAKQALIEELRRLDEKIRA